MVIKIPQRHTFPESLRKEILDKTGCSLPEWEISVPKRDDIAWSVVLSYLTSTNYRDRYRDDFQRRVNLLTGSNVNKKSLKNFIKNFNPFINRYSCFHNKALKTVINDFKIHMKWSNLLSINDKLTAVSEALNCSIVVIESFKKLKIRKIITKNHERSDNSIIILVSTFEESENEISTVTVHNFLIGAETGSKMRNAALGFYLKETKLSRKQKLFLRTIEDDNDSFLVTLLKSKNRNIVLELYRSSYVISKLSDATYDMDPRRKDSKGLSALYHALVSSPAKTNILNKLYYFAVNNCCRNEGSYRNLDSRIVSNLCDMEELLAHDMTNLESIRNHTMYQDLKINFSHLIKFNKFLIEVCGKILNVKNMLNYYESTNENIFEASKRRDVIVVLLETYNKFFHWVGHDAPMQISLDGYICNRNYYNLVDMATAILFFDNIVFLKEKLKLESDNQFSEIEASFFIYIIYHAVFEREDILANVKTMMPKTDKDSLYIFPLIKRDDTLKKLNDFNKILKLDTDINEDNVVKKIPENVVHSTLCSHRVLKDFIELERLKDYIKVGVNVKLTDIKSVLVIERVLQVMGECVEPAGKNLSFKRFLFLCLPKEISRELRNIRNDLTHLKGHAFPGKCECEKNFPLFRSIQSEICYIERHFKLVYHIIYLNVVVYAFEELKDELENAKDLMHVYTSSNTKPLKLPENIMLPEKADLRYGLQQLMSSCQTFLNIALQNLENEVQEEYLSSVNRAPIDVKDRIVHILEPLEWLLKLLKKYEIDNTETILNIYEALKDCNTLHEIKEITDIFLQKYRDFIPELGNEKKRKKFKQVKLIKSIKYFKSILNGLVYLSDEEKNEIRKEIPQSFKESALIRKELIESIKNGFSLDVEANFSKFELTYLSVNKRKQLRDYYQCKDLYALTILESPDPIDELEKIFSDNCVNKKKYETFCEKMEFTDKTKKKLFKLVDGQRKKNPSNNLPILLNRVKLLKKILIEENEEVHNLWNKIVSQKSRQLINDKILDCYLKDSNLRVASEMLLLDCMALLENVKVTENPWIKTLKLYTGINLRNVISHGSPLLESLCLLLDPKDLPSEIIKKMILLIEREDSMEAILQLYEKVNEDYTELQKVINSEGEDMYSNLRSRIVKCNEWKTYSLLLLYQPQNADNTSLK